MELHLRNGSSPAVRRLAGWYERTEHPVVRREVPGGRIVLVISFGPPLDVDGRSYGSFVAGLHETAAITEHAGVSHGVQAYLSPVGAARLFRMPMGELANRGADLADLLPEADELAERLYDAPDWPTRLTLLEAFITRRVEEAPPVPRAVEWAWQRLLSTGGAVPVAELAEELGWSRRHLAARFREHIGLPPKSLARVLRFERAAERLRAGAALADAALDSGYYDQAHFNRDFRAFAGVTPTEYRVASVQDIEPAAA
jgi:AraC-like DNA-binding protein